MEQQIIENKTEEIGQCTRILLTESKNLILFDKPSTVEVIIKNGSEENMEDENPHDLAPPDKSDIFMKDEATQTLCSKCFTVVKQKYTICGK